MSIYQECGSSYAEVVILDDAYPKPFFYREVVAMTNILMHPMGWRRHNRYFRWRSWRWWSLRTVRRTTRSPKTWDVKFIHIKRTLQRTITGERQSYNNRRRNRGGRWQCSQPRIYNVYGNTTLDFKIIYMDRCYNCQCFDAICYGNPTNRRRVTAQRLDFLLWMECCSCHENIFLKIT